MIVTYTVSLRGGNGESTITIPNIETDDEEVLLNHIKTKCEEHYNSCQLCPHTYLSNRDKILILLIYTL
mgnify:FL=1